jgi:hypothetical protein
MRGRADHYPEIHHGPFQKSPLSTNIPMIEGEPEEYPRSSLDHPIDQGMVAQIDKCDLGIARSFGPSVPLLGVIGEAIVQQPVRCAEAASALGLSDANPVGATHSPQTRPDDDS